MTSTTETFAGPAPAVVDDGQQTAEAVHGVRTGPLRVVVVDDHPLYREGIVRALEAAGILVVGEAGDGDAALALIRERQPDVALLDVSMPGPDGIDVVAALVRQGPAVPVVLLSAFGDPALILAGLQAGAATYINKTANRAAIVAAVAAAADPAKAPGALVGFGNLLPGHRQQRIPHLTLQEHSLLKLAQDNVDKREMALRLGIDEPTVRRNLSGVLAKIGADTLPQALEIAVRAGVLRSARSRRSPGSGLRLGPSSSAGAPVRRSARW